MTGVFVDDGLVDTTFNVRTASRQYRFDSGIGLARNPAYWEEALREKSKVALISSAPLLSRFEWILEALPNPQVLVVPDGEDAKTLAVVSDVYRRLAEARFPRTGVIVGVGGGSVTDLAGFVAATWKRGVGLIHVPTTVTGQVDAALGGKCGVNMPGGKNLVGAIYQPERVVADRGVLESLPERDFRGGLAEIIKCGFISDPAILKLVEGWPDGRGSTGERLRELICRSVRVKLDLVEQDELDFSVRRHLNYGHTLGQALEAVTSFQEFNHGEAVGLGMLFAASVADILGDARGLLDETRQSLEQVGLPTRVPPSIEFGPVWNLMSQDKKAGSAGREFVVCERPGVAKLMSMPSRVVAVEAFAGIAAKP